MSEQLHTPSPEASVETTAEVTAERPQAAEYGSAEKEQRVEKARAALASAAEKSSANRAHTPQLPATDDRPLLIDKAAKTIRLKRNLGQVQSKLKPAEKSFSKLVHQPLVQKVSETSAKTVARPSGVLGGGVVAFVGSLGYFWLTHYYSLPYNYIFFVVFFIGGFLVGVAGEYSLWALRRLKH